MKGGLTIRIKDDSVIIQVEDRSSGTNFIEVSVDHNGFLQALGRLGHVKCDFELRGIDRVGKRHEWKKLEFEIPDEWSVRNDTEYLRKTAQDILDNEGEGWISDGYFSAQNTFFKKDGVQYARVTVRRYV